MTIAVNLYGAPGSGKSSGASYVFSQLKLNGINCEYVSEFAKDKCWEGNKNIFSIPENQFYIGANQFYRMSSLLDKVDVIVTDSPIFLNSFYNKSDILGEEYNKIMLRLSDMFFNINFYVNRVKPYFPKGRNQTMEQADSMDMELRKYLKNKIDYIEVNGDKDGYNKILDFVLDCLKKH